MDNLFANNDILTVLAGSKEVVTVVATNAEMAKKEKEVAMKEAAAKEASVPVPEETTVVTDVSENSAETVVVDGAATDTSAVEGEAVTDTAADVSTVEGEAATDSAAETGTVEGEAAGDGTVSEEVIATDAMAKEGAVVDPGYVDPGYVDPGMNAGEGTYTDAGIPAAKDPLLSSWPFVIGISAAVLFVSVVLGILLAKRKIKKGIELYED